MRRRDFLARLGGTGAAAVLVRPRPATQNPQQPDLPGQGDAGTLRDPASAGNARPRATARDNDEFVKAVEHRLRCTCGCTLDVYTCRTTDFTCTYSPAMHREVLVLQDQGLTADQIVQAFVDKYGEKVLMAPPARGFDLAGYIVPGLLILLIGSIMLLVLWRRTRLQPAAAEPGAEAAGAAPQGEVLAGTGAASSASATPEELARLERELRELEP